MGWNVVGLASIILWTATFATINLMILKVSPFLLINSSYFSPLDAQHFDLMRVPEEIEKEGIVSHLLCSAKVA